MSLIKHQNSKNWYSAFMIDGKRHFKSTGTANKQLATRIEHQYKNEIIARNKLGDGREPITLNKAFDLYIKTRNVSEAFQKTQNSIDRVLGVSPTRGPNGKQEKVFGFDGSKQIHTFADSDINTLIANRKLEGYKPNTIFAHVSALRGAIKHADGLGFLTNRNLKYPTIKIPRQNLRYLSRDEVNLL